jgi:hypothetical protein
MTVDLADGELRPHIHREPAEVDLGIDDWLEALGAVFAAPLLIAAELALNAAEDAFRALIDHTVGAGIRAVAGQIQETLNTAVLSAGLGNAQLTGVAITPYGILVQLQVTTPPPARLNPILGIEVDQQIADLGPAGSGTVSGVTCDKDAAYHYDDHHWWTMITLAAIPHDLGDQVSFEWTVNGAAVGPGTTEQFVPAHTYDGSPLPDPGRIQRILSPGGASLRINHSPPDGNLNLYVRCVARNAGGREASRGEVLMIMDHQRTYEARYAEDVGACIRHLVDDLGRGPVQWPPDSGDPVAWRDRLIDDHIGPLIRGEAVSGIGAVEMSSLVGLLTAEHAKVPWLQQLRPDIRDADAFAADRAGRR